MSPAPILMVSDEGAFHYDGKELAQCPEVFGEKPPVTFLRSGSSVVLNIHHQACKVISADAVCQSSKWCADGHSLADLLSVEGQVYRFDAAHGVALT
jgi:hypothetical protein